MYSFKFSKNVFQSQNKHLLQLSKDRNLEEREQLQLQLSDVNYKMQQQQETIQVTFNIYF